MTTDQLIELARRDAVIQWTRSRVVEKVFVGKKTRRVYCKNLITREFHTLKLTTDEWHVREVTLDEHVRFGDLLPPRLRKNCHRAHMRK